MYFVVFRAQNYLFYDADMTIIYNFSVRKFQRRLKNNFYLVIIYQWKTVKYFL